MQKNARKLRREALQLTPVILPRLLKQLPSGECAMNHLSTIRKVRARLRVSESRPPFPSPSQPGCRPAEKNPAPAANSARTCLSKWRAQREAFERERGELPGGTVEQKLGAPL
jgi:hypothetical protein